MGYPSILFIVFLILKLVHSIDWSWWWVTAPLWIEGIVSLVVLTAGVSVVRAVNRRF